MEIPIVVIVVAVLAFAYPLFMRAIAYLAFPVRMRMAETGKELLAAPRLPEEWKEVVSRMLDDAFDWRVMIVASVVLPTVILRRGGARVSQIPRVTDQDTKKQLNTFMNTHIKATAAANPLFAMVVAIEVAIIMLLLFPFGIAYRMADLLLDAFSKTDRMLNQH